jgi:hypothetical protein
MDLNALKKPKSRKAGDTNTARKSHRKNQQGATV